MNYIKTNLNKIYNIYLVVSFVVLLAIAFLMNKHLVLSIVMLVFTLTQCYFIFHNKGKLIGFFSITNCGMNGYVNLINGMYSLFVYSIYGAFVGGVLLFKGTNEQKLLNFKKIIFRLSSIIGIGIITFIILNWHHSLSIILILDLIIFVGLVTGGFLASQQSIWQFYLFIPMGLLQIIAGLMLHEPIYIITSCIYLFSDLLALLKWRMEHEKLVNKLEYGN